jgi:hypothetical protein
MEMSANSYKLRMDGTYTRITPHALARCMQRNGVMSLGEIERQTWGSLCISRMQSGHWPKSRTGNFDQHDKVTLQTYVLPLANGRRSRWAGYLEAVGTVPPMSVADIRRGDKLYASIFGRLRDLDAVRPMCERFPFLMEPYEHTEDPQAARWDAARKAATEEAQSVIKTAVTSA